MTTPPEVRTSPAEVLGLMAAAIAASPGETRECLITCRRCCNHLLYLLDTAPYTARPQPAIMARLRAMPDNHEHFHGSMSTADSSPPRIRWVTS